MSFRHYPRYVKGNPQLRIFLPNFWMKLVKPKIEQPPNIVHFIIPLEMTEIDVKNYLEKIYKISVNQVRTRVYTGKIKKTHKNYLIKEDDYRMAFVNLAEGYNFEFPDLFPEEKRNKKSKEEERIMDQAKALEEHRKKNIDRPGVPSWFGI